MMKEALDAYFEAPNTELLKAIVAAAAEMALEGSYSSIWRQFVRSSLQFSEKQSEIMSIAAELCGYADLALVNLADFVELDPSAVFSFCYVYFQKDARFCKRLLNSLTVHENEVESEEIVEITPYEVVIDDFSYLFPYCELSAEYIRADYSYLLLELFRLNSVAISSSIEHLSTDFCAFLRKQLLAYDILHETGQILACELLEGSNELSELCINESRLGRELGVFMDIFGCSPLTALDLGADATAVFGHLASIDTAAAERCCLGLRIDAKTAVEDGIRRLSSHNWPTEISLFTVLAEKAPEARAYVSRLNCCRLIPSPAEAETAVTEMTDNGIILHVERPAGLTDGMSCAATELPWLKGQKLENFLIDLIRSSCDISIYNIHIRMQAALFIVFTALPRLESIVQMSSHDVEEAVQSLVDYGLAVELNGQFHRTRQQQVYEVYDGQYLYVTPRTDVQCQEEQPQAVKAQICRALKCGEDGGDLNAKFGVNAEEYLKELEEDCVVELDEMGKWRLAE